MDWKNDPAYYGKILTGDYSRPLKERVAKCITINRDFEDTGNPSICYIAAWHEKDRIIWYEFASRRLGELLGCKSSQVAKVFRNSVVERRVYKYQAEEPGIKKEIIHQRGTDQLPKTIARGGKKDRNDRGGLQAGFIRRPDFLAEGPGRNGKVS